MNYDSTDSDFDADSSSITSQEVLVQCFICISLASIKFPKVCVPPPNEPSIFEQISQHGTSDDNTQPTPLPVSIKC